MHSFCPRVVSLFAAAVAAAPLAAQWRQIPTNPSPARTAGISLVPMPTGGLLLFGGDAANPAATEWLWSGTHWRPLTTAVPRRSQQAMAAHGRTADVYVFGGLDAANQPLTDTWRYDGIWHLVATATTPSVMNTAEMAYDPKADAMVVVGSNAATGVLETWSLGTDWVLTQATIAGTPSGQCALCTDSVRGSLLLFRVHPGVLEVFELTNGDWQLRTSAPMSLPSGGDATFDPIRGRAIFYSHLPGLLGQTYEYDGKNLVLADVGSIPPGHTNPQMDFAFDAARGEAILVAQGIPCTTWSWSPRPIPFATAYGASCISPNVQLELMAGDVPTIGAAHRLLVPYGSGSFGVGVLGLSHVQDAIGLLPRPVPGTQCTQQVEALSAVFFATATPVLQLTVPNAPAMLGLRYDSQFVLGDTTGFTAFTNGLEVQIGMPPAENRLIETFAGAQLRDPVASGDAWGTGFATPVALGGSGRHGSFSPSFGTALGNGVYQFDTGNTVIPAVASLTGQTETITDGIYEFTDFVVPAGTTITFRGSVPARILVRGRVDIQGSVRLDGAAMTTFNAIGVTATSAPFIVGQPGGEPGAGGGRGGRGGDECQGTGPIIVNNEIRTNGADGEGVRVAASHAYAAQAVGTGGHGAAMHPASGLNSTPTTPPYIANVYRAYFAPGGGGGGFSGPGGVAVTQPLAGMNLGTAPAGGNAFNLFPIPANTTSLEHFTVGGSGGGGGATHAFGTIFVQANTYSAGCGGSGGGGACAIRSGGDLTVQAGAVLSARGGDGALVNGRVNNTSNNADWGIASPGGGGSGGSFLLQSAANATVAGDIDTSGGPGSHTGNISITQVRVNCQAGGGAPGFYRIEAAGSLAFTGTGIPAYNAGQNAGSLADTDAHSGSRSLWLRPATTALPRYLRYELIADVNGTTVTYSDDPAVSGMAADDPNGAVLLRFQGAAVDPVTGQVATQSAGPWRTRVTDGPASLNSDRAEALRFDLVLDKLHGPVQVRELRVIWR